ncbi:MAG: hypothetical protein H7Z12_15760 [Rhodospirillaceae bacterium]|nr:hypothetical protein [Rhodospirillales bacterium]
MTNEMIGFAAERLMALEVESLTGVGHGERNPADRLTQRNGYTNPRDTIVWSPDCSGKVRLEKVASATLHRIIALDAPPPSVPILWLPVCPGRLR